MTNLYSLFKLPKFDDPEQAQTAKLLFSVLGLTLIFFVLSAIQAAFMEPTNFFRAVRSVLIIVGISGVISILIYRKHLMLASILYLFQIWMTITIAAIAGAGMETPAVEGYLLVVLAAGLLIGWRAGLITNLLCFLTELSITYAEFNGLLGTYIGVRTPLTYLIVYILISNIVFMFVYYYSSSMKTSLHLAKQELTDRQRAEQALSESETRMRVFANASFEGIAISIDNRIIEANPQFSQLLGYSLADLYGTPVEQLIAPESLELILSHIATHFTDPYEAILVRKDGTRFPVEIRGRPIEHEGQKARLSVVRDLTAWKQAKLEVEQTNYQLSIRLKELTTLHTVSQIIQSGQLSQLEVFQKVVAVIGSGWQYPEIAEARISYGGAEVTTPGFRSTPWMQRADFHISNGQAGALEISYLEEKPFEDEGPFFIEERNLIGTLAEMLTTHLERREAEQNSQRQLTHISSLQLIDAAIITSTDLNVILEIVLDHVMQQLEADAAAFFLLKPSLVVLEFAVGRGLRTTAFQLQQPQMNDIFSGEVVFSRHLVHIPNIAETPADSHRIEIMQAEGIVSYLGIPLIAKGEVTGVLEVFHRSAVQLDPKRFEFLKALAGQAAIAIDNLGLFQTLKQRNLELALAYDVTLEGWSKALDLRDKETEGHTLRVTEMTLRLARMMGVLDKDLASMRQGALLHDVGKLGIPDRILLKSGPLTDEEWIVMRRHPVYAYEWLSPIAHLRPALDIPYCHHEKWDGSGYPRGLSSESIPLSARIFAIVDVYDALTSDRPYRKAWTAQHVKEYLEAERGKHFDPQVVDAFISMLNKDVAKL